MGKICLCKVRPFVMRPMHEKAKSPLVMLMTPAISKGQMAKILDCQSVPDISGVAYKLRGPHPEIFLAIRSRFGGPEFVIRDVSFASSQIAGLNGMRQISTSITWLPPAATPCN